MILSWMVYDGLQRVGDGFAATCFRASHRAASRLAPTGFNQAQGRGR
jgi:hypothetical protein